MTQLETLGFRGPGIGDETLLRLQKLPKLKSLLLDSTDVTDDGLQYLPGLAALEELALLGPAFTDAGLQHLHSLRRLRHLQADRRNLSPAAVETLRAVLPDCRIETY